MKNPLLMLAGAAVLSLASCSQEKTTEVTTAPAATDGTATTTTTMTTTTAPESAAMIEARAQRIADKMVANMKITDAATKTKIRTVYVNRAKRMSEMKTKYATDTTGMAAAMRDASTETDKEFRVIFVEPTQYQAYESSRSTYDDSNYIDDASMSNTGTSTDATSSGTTDGTSNMSSTDNSMSGSTDAMSATKMKAKGEDGSKIKVKENGKVKTKDADGPKTKN